MNTERVTDRQAFEEALREDQIAEDNARSFPLPAILRQRRIRL